MDEINKKWDKVHKFVLEWQHVFDFKEHLWEFEEPDKQDVLTAFTDWLVKSKDINVLVEKILIIDSQHEFPLDEDYIRDIALDISSSFHEYCTLKMLVDTNEQLTVPQDTQIYPIINRFKNSKN